MSFLSDLYYKKLAENERNLRFWEDYLNNLKALDFGVYSDKLKVPVLVPIGNKILFRGELKHTNEVTVALGAGYFAKCSIKQAEVLRQHRIKDAQSKLNEFIKEKEYIENQLSFTQQNVYEKQGQDIVEVYTEEEDNAWRLKHKENIKKQKQKERIEREEQRSKTEEITDEELWNRLEELALQEDLETELIGDCDHTHEHIEKPFVIEEAKPFEYNKTLDEEKPVVVRHNRDDFTKAKSSNDDISEETSKLELLQKVLDKQNELGEKLQELKNKDRNRSCTEADLISKLDEMEELDELEDEMDRLEDIIDTGDIESEEETNASTSPTNLKRSISFADEEDGETLELTFKHSDTEPSTEPYDPKKGINKPSDIYEAYPKLFNTETKSIKSILKKSKYADDGKDVKDKEEKSVNFQKKINILEQSLDEAAANEVERKTVVVNDVVQKEHSDKKLEPSARPTSLFKKRRRQMKSLN